VSAPSFLKLCADAEGWIERGQRALEDETEGTSAEPTQIALAQGEKIGALKNDFAFDAGVLAAEQAEDGKRQRAFAGAALADQAENLAALDFESKATEDWRFAGIAHGDIGREEGGLPDCKSLVALGMTILCHLSSSVQPRSSLGGRRSI
jgi:hypothetical protein